MLDTPPEIPPPVEQRRHSRLGIASFVVSLAIGFSFLLLFIVAGILAQRSPGKPYPGQSIVGVIAMLLFAGDMVAAGLGISGMCQSRVKKVFAILGTVFSILTIIGSVGLIVVGLAYARHATH
jgi:hypothetical protein